MTARADPTPPRRAARRSSRRLLLAGVVVAVAVLALGIVLSSLLLGPRDDARSAAERYLGALAAGDADTVAQMLAPGESSVVDVTIDAFRGATGHLRQVDVTMLEESDDDGVVRATIELVGERHGMDFSVHRDESGWQVDGLSALRVTAAITTAGGNDDSRFPFPGDVRIGGAIVRTGASIDLVPAVYTASPVASELFAGMTEVVVVGDDQDLRVDIAPSPELLPLAQNQIDAYTHECTLPARRPVEHCGLRIPWAADMSEASGFAYRVDAWPAVEFSDDLTSFTATGGDVVVTVSGTASDGSATSATYRAQNWALRGDVLFTDDGVTLAVR